jgi:flagella basal body P-ring formation protein FlgA
MNRLSLKAIAVAVVLAGVQLAVAQAPLTVTLDDFAEVKGDTITVGDVARVETALPDLGRVISELVVADAPEVNATKIVTADAVRTALATLPLDMERIAIGGCENVRVTRSGQRIGPEELRGAVRDYVLEQTGLTSQDVVCDFVQVPAAFAIPTGEVTYTVVPLSNKRCAGYQAFSVCVRIGGVDVETKRVSVKIRQFREVVVAERRIGRDEVIDDEQIKLERREVTNSIGNYFTRADDVVGKRALRSVSAGVLLTDVMVGKPLAVHRKDYVTLRARYGAVTVRTKCVALKDACVGESVDVMNKDSKKVLRARVVAPNLVELEL